MKSKIRYAGIIEGILWLEKHGAKRIMIEAIEPDGRLRDVTERQIRADKNHFGTLDAKDRMVQMVENWIVWYGPISGLTIKVRRAS